MASTVSPKVGQKYSVKNVGTGKYLNVDHNSGTNKAGVSIYSFDGTSGQRFTLSSSKFGIILKPDCNSGVVNVYANNAYDAANVNIYTENKSGSKTQSWKFVSVSGGYKICSADNTKLALNATGSSNRSNVNIKTYNGSKNQIWVLNAVTSKPSSGTEKATLSMNYLNITQGMYGNFSHQGDCAIDIAGKDTGIDNLRAPFTGTIKRISSGSNTVWLESNAKVKYADGTLDYMTVMTTHDNDVSNLYPGKVIKRGETYYQEGTKGNATGNHIHIACGKGKFTGNGWYENSYGKWVIYNQYPINKALFLSKNCTIKNDWGYSWQYN